MRKCELCGKPVKMQDVYGNPKITHIACAMKATAETRALVRAITPANRLA